MEHSLRKQHIYWKKNICYLSFVRKTSMRFCVENAKKRIIIKCHSRHRRLLILMCGKQKKKHEMKAMICKEKSTIVRKLKKIKSDWPFFFKITFIDLGR